jgi:hypothetical protein
MSHNNQGFSCFVKVISTRFSEWNLTFHFSKAIAMPSRPITAPYDRPVNYELFA